MRRLLFLVMMTVSLGFLGVAGLGLAQDKPTVLVFSHSTGWRHSSIETGAAAIAELGRKRGFDVVLSEDPALFEGSALDRFDAIVFLSITTQSDNPESEWFVGDRRQALQNFVHRGGGIVGVHAAADSHYGWPWFGKLIGARFQHHPPGTPNGTVTVTNPAHPAIAGIQPSVERVDEWYYFQDFNPTVNLLATLDPASIGEQDVNPNPVAWTHEFEGARVFYTAMGHTEESYSDPWFMDHLGQGIDWVIQREPMDSGD